MKVVDVSNLSSYIPKLEKTYELTIQQQQVRGFFTHLHNYLEVIRDNPKLNESVWTLVIDNYNQDNPKHKFKGNIKQLADGLTVGSEYQGYLENALDAHKGLTRAYYCWFFLFSAFDLFDMDPEPDDLTMQETILKDLSQGTKALLQEDDSEYRNIFLKNDDSKNKRFRRSDYQLYLEVFHGALIQWLRDSKDYQDNKTDTKRHMLSEDSVAILPPLEKTIYGDFGIHEGGIISYRGKEIILEKRLGDLAAVIMKRSEKGIYTNREYIANEVIDENRDYEAPQDYAIKLVSKLRKDFQKQLDTKHDYFERKGRYGYKFIPVNTHENITK